jgi:hypothetical protein
VPNFEEIEKFMKDSKFTLLRHIGTRYRIDAGHDYNLLIFFCYLGWDERIARINDPKLNLKVLWMKSYAQEEQERREAEEQAKRGEVTPAPTLASGSGSGSSSSSSSSSSASAHSQPPTPKQKNSPQHTNNGKK